jgi:hypothetical protein
VTSPPSLLRTAQPDMSRPTSPQPKMILITYKIDAHPFQMFTAALPGCDARHFL